MITFDKKGILVKLRKYELLTIGYEGYEIDEFVGRLKRFKTSRLIDVREMPISRKRGFSKSALKDRLKDENIEYIHLKALGAPSSIRNKLRSDLDYNHFFKAYNKHISQNLDVIKEINTYIFDGINCLMCFERLPEKCHRLKIAEAVKLRDGNGLKIKHI